MECGGYGKEEKNNTMNIVFNNHQWLESKDVQISPFDHGFLYADAVYETLLVYNKKVYFIEEHWNRLCHSLQFLGMHLPEEYTLQYFTEMCFALVEKNTYANARLRITVSRGENGFDFMSCKNPTVIAHLSSLSQYPEEYYQKGVSVVSQEGIRIFPTIKHINFLSGIVARRAMHTHNAFESLYLSEEGFLREGTISNVFAVDRLHKKIMITPREYVLPGTMQAFVESFLKKDGYMIEEKNYTKEDIIVQNWSLFLSNSLIGVMPISVLDGISLPVFLLFPTSIYEVLDNKI